jgi:hypothetical protein
LLYSPIPLYVQYPQGYPAPLQRGLFVALIYSWISRSGAHAHRLPNTPLSTQAAGLEEKLLNPSDPDYPGPPPKPVGPEAQIVPEFPWVRRQ